MSCDGDSVSTTAAEQPSIEDVLLGVIPGLPKVHLHNPVLAPEVGDDFMRYFYMAEAGQIDPFVLVIEGSIPNEDKFHDFDAERLFEVEEIDTLESPLCISGSVLKGVRKPHDCPAFGKECTPEHPLGATMVSSEGACAAYYLYRGAATLKARG